MRTDDWTTPDRKERKLSRLMYDFIRDMNNVFRNSIRCCNQSAKWIFTDIFVASFLQKYLVERSPANLDATCNDNTVIDFVCIVCL